MPDLTTYLLALIPLAIAGGLIWLYLYKIAPQSEAKREQKAVYQGVVKKGWVATGRIDFATQEGGGGGDDPDRPAEFKLLVEERRIVESIAGNENLEIQWRLASLKEAKVVIANYHKHMMDNGLIKSVSEEASAAAPETQAAAEAAPPLQAEEPEAAKPDAAKPPGEAHMRVVSSNS